MTIGDNNVVGAACPGSASPREASSGGSGRHVCSVVDYYIWRKGIAKSLHNAPSLHGALFGRPSNQDFSPAFSLLSQISRELRDEFREKLGDSANAGESPCWIDGLERAFVNYEKFCQYAEGRLCIK